MKFKISENPFQPTITSVDLSEKEVDYLMMLVSGVEQKQIDNLLSIKKSELEILYLKLGLTNKKRVRDMQATTIIAMNNIITPELLLRTNKKFNLNELSEMSDFIIKTKKRG